MTHLYLIRHAQADGRKPGIVGSAIPYDAGLSPLGIIQAERLRDRFAETSEIPADVLISSPLLRAKETAEIIAPALGLPVIVDDEVQELNLGDGEGLIFEELWEKYGGFGLDHEPFRRVATNSESWAEFTLRACGALDRLIRAYDGKTIVIVCHGRMIDASFVYFLGLSTFKQLPIVLDHHYTSITHWYRGYFDGYAWQESRWCLKRYNDHDHLLDSRLEGNRG
jgi:2,3-bisphosphoglycerate-dependent phosphoglycerate mutase